MIMGPLFVSEEDETNSFGKDRIAYYLLISALICTVMSVWIILFFKSSPSTPPSQAATESSKTEFEFKKDINMLVRNKNYIIMPMT